MYALFIDDLLAQSTQRHYHWHWRTGCVLCSDKRMHAVQLMLTLLGRQVGW